MHIKNIIISKEWKTLAQHGINIDISKTYKLHNNGKQNLYIIDTDLVPVKDSINFGDILIPYNFAMYKKGKGILYLSCDNKINVSISEVE